MNDKNGGEVTGLTCSTCRTPDVLWIAPGGRDAVCLECGDHTHITPDQARPSAPCSSDQASHPGQQEIS